LPQHGKATSDSPLDMMRSHAAVGVDVEVVRKNRDCRPISYSITETIQDLAIVIMEDE